MSEIEEKELIKLLQDKASRRDAFAELVRRYSEMLYWQCRRIVLTHQDADDVLQESFIKIWTNIDSFRGDSKLTTWLYRIVTNESITHVNKLRAEKSISIDDEESFLNQRLESDGYFDGDAAQKKLQKAILTLPEKQRIVFNLRYYDEMKYSEMSDVLDTSVGALKASYHHAAKKVEDYLLSETD